MRKGGGLGLTSLFCSWKRRFLSGMLEIIISKKIAGTYSHLLENLVVALFFYGDNRSKFSPQ